MVYIHYNTTHNQVIWFIYLSMKRIDSYRFENNVFLLCVCNNIDYVYLINGNK